VLYACKGVPGSAKAMSAHTGQREREREREIKRERERERDKDDLSREY
jgi:hypothetical protein